MKIKNILTLIAALFIMLQVNAQNHTQSINEAREAIEAARQALSSIDEAQIDSALLEAIGLLDVLLGGQETCEECTEEEVCECGCSEEDCLCLVEALSQDEGDDIRDDEWIMEEDFDQDDYIVFDDMDEEEYYDFGEAGWRELLGKRSRVHWAGMSLEYNGMVSGFTDWNLPADAEYLSLKNSSLSFSLNLFDYAFVLKRKIAIASGLGLEFNNFKFAQDITLRSNADGMVVPFSYDATFVDVQKSKLVTTYLNIPLIMEVSLGSKGFVNFGVIGGWRMGGHTKVKMSYPGFDGITKSRADIQLANFHYGFTVNAGCGPVAITAKYYPSPIFKKDHGPKVQQMNIGLGLLW